MRVALRQHIPFDEDSALRIATGDDQYGRQRIIVSGLSRRVLPLDGNDVAQHGVGIVLSVV